MAGMPLGLGGMLVLLVLSFVFRTNLFSLLGGGVPGSGSPVTDASGPVASSPEEERLVDFVSFVLDDAQATWAQILPRHGATYQDAKLAVFRDAVDSGCGFAQAQSGPFYCPADGTVYIDLSFYHDLQSRFGASGDFAQAYVIAHEIGHHVQTLLGIEEQVRGGQQSSPRGAKTLSVKMELQADCLAGVWGHSTAQRDILEQGDVEEALNAAAAIGDDRIQSMTAGRVSPESFTHGSSEQRVAWFRRGLDSGDPEACDSFSE